MSVEQFSPQCKDCSTLIRKHHPCPPTLSLVTIALPSSEVTPKACYHSPDLMDNRWL